MPVKNIVSIKNSAPVKDLNQAKKAIPLDYLPMEMQPVKEVPVDDDGQWLYQPKWDGFRCLAFCENGKVELRSKKGQSLGRYFPEVVASLAKISNKHFILDGELMIWHGKQPSFDHLLQRIHPAASRINKLSLENPATYIVFDLLAESSAKNGVEYLHQEPLKKRYPRLEKFAAKYFGKAGDIILSPATDEAKVAIDWFKGKGVELDGVVAKHLDMPYQSGNRTGTVKVKRAKTADCVIGGFRYGASSKDIGSLLLGLYDDQGELHHVGFTSAFSASEKHDLTEKLEPLAAKKSFTVHVPGGPSRWNNGKESPWTPVKPSLVVEVKYDHFSDGRFRHGTSILRWRPDKKAKQCKFDQI